MSSEKVLENEILYFLNTQKDVFAEKRNNMGVYDARAGSYRKNNNPYILKGTSDISGIAYGKAFAIEVKYGRNKPSDEQIAYLKKIIKMGGYAQCVWSLDEAIQFLDDIKNNKQGEIKCKP